MAPDTERTSYYNSVLAFYGAWLREQAFGHGLRFVDMYSPINRLTTEQRKFDPKEYDKMYAELQAKTIEFINNANEYQDKIYQINEPKTLRYEIVTAE